MSGGSFDYAYSRVVVFADELEEKLSQNDVEEDGWKYGFEPSTVAKLREIEAISRKAAALMKEAEWLYSGDTSDDSFMDRVHKIEVSNA